MVKRSSTPSQQVRSKRAKLKMIHQMKATDRPTEVKAMLQERRELLLRKLSSNKRKAKSYCRLIPGDAPHQLVRNIGCWEHAIDAWMRDVTATAIEIVAKFNELQHEHIALLTR